MIKDSKGLDRKRIGSLQGFSGVYSNDFSRYLLEKSERLASALYLITGYIPEGDPTRERLRSAALDIVKQASMSHDFSELVAERLSGKCLEIGAILETAQYVGLISPMNARMVSNDYAELASYAHNNHEAIARRGAEIGKDSLYPPKDNVLYKGHTDKKDRSDSIYRTPSRQKTSIGHHGRTEKLLRLLRRRGVISIKDAEAEFNDLGSKTVQRLLLGLVSKGTIQKMGDRRWSTYRLPAAGALPVSQDAPQGGGDIENLENIA